MSVIQAQQMKLKFAGSAESRIQSMYVADQFASVSTAALGATAVLTTADPNILLLGYNINVSATLAAPGELVITLETAGAVVIATYGLLIPVGGASATWDSNFVDGYGFLTAEEDNTINVVLSSALATGHVRVNAFGVFSVFPIP